MRLLVNDEPLRKGSETAHKAHHAAIGASPLYRSIRYRKRRGRAYKFVLERTHVEWRHIKVAHPGFYAGHLEISSAGRLTISAGYAWDGATWCPDLRSIIPASLVHDALCQLSREGAIAPDQRQRIDEIFREICLDSGMWPPLACFAYRMVRLLGGKASKPDILTAP